MPTLPAKYIAVKDALHTVDGEGIHIKSKFAFPSIPKLPTFKFPRLPKAPTIPTVPKAPTIPTAPKLPTAPTVPTIG